MPPLAWQEFEASGPNSVVKIEFARGSKEYFRDAIHFWIVFLESQFHHANLSNAGTFFYTLQGQFGTVDDVEEKRWIVIVIIFLLAGKIIHGGMRGVFVYGTATWLRCQVDNTPP